MSWQPGYAKCTSESMDGVRASIGLLLSQSLAGQTTDSAFGCLAQEKDVMAEDLLLHTLDGCSRPEYPNRYS